MAKCLGLIAVHVVAAAAGVVAAIELFAAVTG